MSDIGNQCGSGGMHNLEETETNSQSTEVVNHNQMREQSGGSKVRQMSEATTNTPDEMLNLPTTSPAHTIEKTPSVRTHKSIISNSKYANTPLEQSNINIPLEDGKHLFSNEIDTETLPNKSTISLGLAQVFVGGSMVICGIFALRYQSYLFHYGSGFWAGTVAGLTGALGIMSTKRGLPKPKWLCGGRKWQIHVYLAAALVAISAAILLAIFSTAGLVRDTQHFVGMETRYTWDEERFERRKSSGIAINAILLFLSLIEILLGFCSIGVALRVLCYSRSGKSLLSSSSASQVNDIIGAAEYRARKDRLINWIGHQRRSFWASMGYPATAPPSIHPSGKSRSVLSVAPYKMRGDRLVPHFVAVTPYHIQPPPMYAYPPQMRMGMPPPPPYGYPHPMFMYGPPPPQFHQMSPHHRRAHTPAHSLPASEGRIRRERCYSESSLSNGKLRRKREREEKVDITEDEVARTYTGLDRSIAEDYINNTMSSR